MPEVPSGRDPLHQALAGWPPLAERRNRIFPFLSRYIGAGGRLRRYVGVNEDITLDFNRGGASGTLGFGEYSLEKDKIMDQEDKYFKIILATQILDEFNTSFKIGSLYPPGHPIFLKNLEKLETLFTKYFQGATFLRWRIKGNTFYYGGEPLEKENPVFKKLALNFYQLGIREIIFLKELEKNQLSKFISVLQEPLETVMFKGGIEKILEKDKLAAIKVNVTIKEEIVRVTPLLLKLEEEEKIDKDSETRIIDYLNGENIELTVQEEKLLLKLVDHPQDLSDFMTTLSASEISAEQEDESSNKVPTYLWNVLKKIEKIFTRTASIDTKKYYKEVVEAILHLGKELKDSLIQKQLLSKIDQDELAANLVAEFPDTELIDILTAKFAQEETSQEKRLSFLNSIPFAKEKMKKLQDILDVMVPIQEEIRSQPTAVKPPERPQPREKELIKSEALTELVTEISSYSEKELKELAKIEQAVTESTVNASFLKVLEDILIIEQDINTYLLIVNQLEELLLIFIEHRQLPQALKVLKLFKEQLSPAFNRGKEFKERIGQALEMASSKEIIQKLFDILRTVEKSSVDYLSLTAYLSLLGQAAIPYFLDILAEEKQISLRRFLCQVLADIGKDRVDLFEERLQDPRWYVVRNLVFILGLIRDKKAIDSLVPLLEHPHLQVRVEVIKTVGLIGSPKVLPILVRGLKDKNKQIKQLAVEWLGRIANPQVIPILMKIINEFDPLGSSVALKKKALVSLQTVARKEALPFIKKISHYHWWNFFRYRLPLIRQAQQIVKELEADDGRIRK